MAETDTIITLKTLIEANDRRYADLHECSQKALEVALIANEKRMDALNTFREAINDTNLRMMTRVEGLAAIQTATEKTLSDIEPLRERIEFNARPKYGLIAGFGSLLFGSVAALWLVIGLQISSAIAPVSVAVETLKVGQTGQAQDIEAINTRVTNTSNFITTQIAERQKQITEINTQITRLNVWLDFVHAKVYPNSPVPPTKP